MNINIDSGRVERLSGMRTGGVFLVSGTVHMIRNEAELPYVREGEIVVAEPLSKTRVRLIRWLSNWPDSMIFRR